MQKISKHLLLFSMVMILLVSVSSAYAGDSDSLSLVNGIGSDSVDDIGSSTVSTVEDSSYASSVGGSGDSIASSSNLASGSTEGPVSGWDECSVENDKDVVYSGSSSNNALKDSSNASNGSLGNGTYYIDSTNFNEFFADNVLKSEYANSTLIFGGNFDNFGVIKFTSDNVRVTAKGSLFYNTVFDLGANGIVLSNIKMVLDKEFKDNHQSGIYVHGDNITIYNCTLNYTTPENVTAFGIYSDGHNDDFVGLNVINNTINLLGHAFDANTYNYPILLRNTHDSLVYGNHIDCELPIKYIVWSFSGAYGSVSMDTVAAFAADYCENLTLSNNYIHSTVNGGDDFYPTLDTVILYGCSYSLIENNTIISEDFFTQAGKDNYLQALDLYNLNDVTVIGNNISVITNGGKPGMGTAYPIQINGPVYNTKVAFNNLTTFNNGPNCGIYSQNYYGDTFIDIISNFINVTGNASNDGTNPSWCLVSGIEVQDSGDNILNNTIIVNNLGDYKSNVYVYGISYVQNTGGGHTYNIQYNNITTNGNYGVKILGNVKNSTTYNSTISNNVINTHTTSCMAGASTNRQVDGPTGTTIKNNTNGNPRNVMSEDYYPDWLKDYVREGSGRGTGDFAWLNRILNPSSNGTGFSGAVGNGTSHSGSGNARGNGHGSHDGDVSGNGTDSNSDAVLGSDHDSAPGVGGDVAPSISAASPSDSGSSAANPNAYEIDEHDNVVSKSSDYLQLGLICIVALLLLLVGYKRQKDKEEEE
ncbi:hypothetical protein [Methanobrevibacter ruminantium]|uniref:hypothetical protein n=1 Tax=Methanobrevibacter ruminantium TaxID=83816 RepID=UPI0026F25504|nr:hypothetical protein [Methanobrevibacter ruminantium]